MARLKVVARYVNRTTIYEVGKILDVTNADRRFLMADCPGCFEDYQEPEAKMIDAPPVDKAVKKATTRRRRATTKKDDT